MGTDQKQNEAVSQGAAYEVLSQRLKTQADAVRQLAESLNESRLDEFGRSDMALHSRVRIRTENNCLARDTVQVGDLMVFGYNVFIGLKTETRVEDVFSLFRRETVVDEGDAGTHTLESVTLENTFLKEPGFARDFDELYRFYKNAKFLQFRLVQDKLLASFQLGERMDDIRVFRWRVNHDGSSVSYIDNRGERDIELPPAFDFEWRMTTREQTVVGRHPHVNILDQIFVETIQGDLTIKVENNTETGQGIYSEPVEEATQSIDDAEIAFADLGTLILLKVLPYKEQSHRYFVFNKESREVARVDGIGQSCVQLPEDHGIIFPGGYYLTTGAIKTFPNELEGWRFKRQIRSPNGEDCLCIFYHPESGKVSLLGYNLISKDLQNPIEGQGYALSSDGTLILSLPEPEPTRIHPMQIWTTPFYSDEHAADKPVSQSLLGRIGNAELVRGISELFSLVKSSKTESVTAAHFESLAQEPVKFADTYYWLSEMPELQSALKALSETAERVLDEFEKVEAIRLAAKESLARASREQKALLQSLRPEEWQGAEQYAEHLDQIQKQRGHIKTLRETRYIDLEALDELDQELAGADESLSAKTIDFLSQPTAFEPYQKQLKGFEDEIEAAETHAELAALLEGIDRLASGVDLLSELAGSLSGAEVNVQTQIVDSLSAVYTLLNQKRAKAQNRAKNLGLEEARSQFGAQLRLFSQGVSHAISQADTPEKADSGLARLLVQLEEMESRFSTYDEFLSDILQQREQLYESFEAHKQQLLDARQQKNQTLTDAGLRMIATLERRTKRFQEEDELNAFATSDPLIRRLHDTVERLRANEAAVAADDLESRLKAALDQALRGLRDKADLYEAGGAVIKLGPKHRFSVNTQELDLTLLPREEGLFFHLTGTQYYSPVPKGALEEFRPYWNMMLESESTQVYRAEYLAYELFPRLDTARLADETELLAWVQKEAAERYREAYTKGVHDHDAALILKALAPLEAAADSLRFPPLPRALAQIFWATLEKPLPRLSNLSAPATKAPEKSEIHFYWPSRAQAAFALKEALQSEEALNSLRQEVAKALNGFLEEHAIEVAANVQLAAASYLVAVLANPPTQFAVSKYASELLEVFNRELSEDHKRTFHAGLKQLQGQVGPRWFYSSSWLEALVRQDKYARYRAYVPEAVALLNTEERLSRLDSPADLEARVEGLLGDHENLQGQVLHLRLDDFHQRLQHHHSVVAPNYRAYLQARQELIDDERKRLRLHEFKPKPLTTFVRNKLITQSYLPLIGDNFAKQMGTVGEDRRTDSQGLLMMISPPGYGKTTLMEYVASRLGLIFMKINCPSLGHSVDSLDPEKAPNATARQELEKLNLSFEMGNNVLLYLDDIQHTNPEFLQKFISLCDGTRRIEGVWQRQTRTYDLRGRRFAIAMAGNPYTESGDVFKIPDMLANRADVYNLGDILGGMEEAFALSYVENSLSANPVLAPLANRDMADVYTLVRMAEGENVPASELRHSYSGAELQEIVAILEKMFAVRDIVLRVNQQYIASAAQDDKYRTEPPFKLQGSYRNMNKLASKLSAVMNDKELEQLIDDHYAGESQLLTTGAEENLLKLKELRQVLSDKEAKRWKEVCALYVRARSIGGSDQDTGQKVVAMLSDLVAAVSGLKELASLSSEPNRANDSQTLAAGIQSLVGAVEKVGQVSHKIEPKIEIVNQPHPRLGIIMEAIAATLENGLTPLVHSMEKKLEVDLGTHHKLVKISAQLRDLAAAADQSDGAAGHARLKPLQKGLDDE